MRAKNLSSIQRLSLIALAIVSASFSLAPASLMANPGPGHHGKVAPGSSVGSESIDGNDIAQEEEVYEHELMVNGERFYVTNQELEEILKLLDLN